VVADSGKILATSQDIWPDHLDCVVAADRGFAQAHPEVVQRLLQAHQDSTAWVLSALARPDSEAYQRLIELAVQFTGRDPAVVKQAFNLIHYKTEVDAGFSTSLMEYTDKLIEFNIIPSDRLAERGYDSVKDFAAKYVDASYQEMAKGD
jgi:ABC-type nitrate/sulfonate/bicarbonate transport system substrate-binding protein